ncbi:hypothetical protein EDD18DRAFT_1173380 [Armillaria luteobubalina]|uniref:Antifungal protein n=1 Tax=Armillaria luteobubalina TaxID=153913 RepID=A0AA39Q522_9AGAR|nr:hypothetical protein EDD18DRAFT_1173380 [Armillaria luteobubalina]
MQTRFLLSIFLALCTMNIMAAPNLQDEDTKYCSNGAKIAKNDDRWASEGCDPSSSKGLLSAHNCKTKGGKYYLCKQGDTWTCTKVKNMIGMEKGECFL